MRTGSGKQVVVVGEGVAFEPPCRFVHTHRFTRHDDPVCQVSSELKPAGAGAGVTLRVIGLPANTPTANSMAGGGTLIPNILKAIAETGRPRLPTRLMLMYWVFDLEFVVPRRTRTEHSPLIEP